MSSTIRNVLLLLLIPVVFAAGLYAGPRVAGLYYAVFPPKQYSTGNHDVLYAKAGNDVVMYATTTCPYCTKVRKLFAEQGVRYTEYRIDTSESANADFKARKGIGVPLLYIGERRIDGYREAAIHEAVAALR